MNPIPTVIVVGDALQVSVDIDRSRVFAPDGTTITGAGDKFAEIDQANEELLRQARAARNRDRLESDLGSLGRKRAVVLDAWAREDLPEAIRFTRKAYIALVNPDECEIGEAAVQHFGPRAGVAEPPSLADFKEALQAARLFEASGPVWIRRA